MNNKKIVLPVGIVAIMVLLAALSRMLPHPPNFTPIGSMALFGAAYFTKKYWAFIIPIASLFISDLLLNNIVYAKMFPEYYNGFVWFTQGAEWIYGAFILITLLGFRSLQKVNIKNIVLSSLSASGIFFLLTNLGVWFGSGMYPKTIAGLIACFTAAVPFFMNTIAGDLFFAGVLFGAYALIQRQFFKPVLINNV